MRTLLFLIGLSILATSCEKIVAEDITAETPVLILPTVNDTVSQNPVHFKWEAMEGASKYRLQVVSPSFSSINEFLLDSLITGTNFYFQLDSNEYELKLTALNGGYESQTLGPIKFWVGVASTGGTGSNVVLNSPSDQAYVNGQFSNQFTWTPLAGATSYEYSLREGASFATGLVLNAQNGISTSTYTVPNGLLAEGNYYWGVKAYLGAVETPFTVYQLSVDDTDPNSALLSTPAHQSFDFAGTISFTWSNGTDPGTVHAPVTSILEVATDAGFVGVIQTVTISGNSTTINLPAGVYYWRVTNEDGAGNSAAPSIFNQFTLN